MAEIFAPEPLGDVQRIGGGPSQLVEPRFPVKATRFNYQRVAVPLAGGVTHPGGIEIGSEVAPIQEDLPPQVERLVHDDDKVRRLNHFPRRGRCIDLGHALGQAIRVWLHSGLGPVGALLEHRFSPGLQRNILSLQIGGNVAKKTRIRVPNAGQVGMAAHARRWGREIRLAIGRAWNVRRRHMDPLRACRRAKPA